MSPGSFPVFSVWEREGLGTREANCNYCSELNVPHCATIICVAFNLLHHTHTHTHTLLLSTTLCTSLCVCMCLVTIIWQDVRNKVTLTARLPPHPLLEMALNYMIVECTPIELCSNIYLQYMHNIHVHVHIHTCICTLASAYTQVIK